MSEQTKEAKPTFNEIMSKAAASALRGGVAGAAAMGANVACLMWMRTTVSRLYEDDISPVFLNLFLFLSFCFRFDSIAFSTLAG